jgi:Ca2+/Na+ antiporter
MATGPKRGKRRPRPKKSKQNNALLIPSLGAVLAFIFIIFFIAAGFLSTIVGAVVCMIILAVLFYFISKPNPRRRRRPRSRPKPQEKEPQFYTALPSTLGLSEIPEEIPTPQVKLPPRPIRAARRRRDFVTYPLAVGGGDYSDSYMQADKDTILRLRSEMTPDTLSLKLPGIRIGKFPSSKIASVMSKEVESNISQIAVPVSDAVVEPVVAIPVGAVVEPVVAIPVAAAIVEPVVAIPVGDAAGTISIEEEAVATPVVQPVSVEEEEEMDFDMEWD